eukprot:12421710-Karenia_brevis.AAC.1
MSASLLPVKLHCSNMAHAGLSFSPIGTILGCALDGLAPTWPLLVSSHAHFRRCWAHVGPRAKATSASPILASSSAHFGRSWAHVGPRAKPTAASLLHIGLRCSNIAHRGFILNPF